LNWRPARAPKKKKMEGKNNSAGSVAGMYKVVVVERQ
jgi:hypothetical protein